MVEPLPPLLPLPLFALEGAKPEVFCLSGAGIRATGGASRSGSSSSAEVTRSMVGLAASALACG